MDLDEKPERAEIEELRGEEYLLAKASEQDFITYDDILTAFPEAEENLDELEDVLVILMETDIQIADPEDQGEQIAEAAQKSEGDSTIVDEGSYLDVIRIDDSIGLYLKEIGQVPLLTREEEIELAKRMEAGRGARERLREGGVPQAESRPCDGVGHPTASRRSPVGASRHKGGLTPQGGPHATRDGLDPEEKAELKQTVADGLMAREHLVRANSRLVVSVAKKYMGRGVPFIDLIQEGNIGLIRAAKKFDYTLGNKFSTYATWWIRQAVTRAIADQSRTIRIPVHMGDQINKLLRTTHRLTQELGREPTPEEMAEELDIPTEKVENMLQVARRPLSLELPIDEQGDSELGDFIENDEAVAPDDVVSSSILRELLLEVLEDLPPREVRILQMRYGLVDGETYTLEEVGQKLGVTRERIRQIEVQALSRLRHPTHARRLRDFLR